ncbi:MAG: cation:proton antiporter [Candidatus Dormibacteria bacterium]
MVFGTLAIVLGAGLLGPLLAAGRRPLVPVVVGELIAGVVLGRTGFRIIDIGASPPFPVFYSLGFAMLMMTAGTHVNLASPDFKSGAGRGAAAVAVVAVLAVPTAFLVHQVFGAGSFTLFAVLLAGSSAAVAFPIIEEHHLKGSPIPLLIAWIALADSITVVLLPLTLTGARDLVPSLLGDAAIITAGVAIYFAVAKAFKRVDSDAAWAASRQRGWGLQIRLSVLLLLILASIADRTGASILVAGFLAGMILVRLREGERLEVQLVGVANGFLVPIFFVLLGARIDLRALLQEPAAIGVALALAVGAVLIHVAAAAVAGQDKRVPTGLAASAQLGLPAAAASLGLASHRLSPAIAAALVAAGCLTLVPASVGGLLLARGAKGDPTA